MKDRFLFEIVSPLLDWYEKNARDLPWRKDRDPYRVWVSEIMLQQTRVTAVIPYYLRFMETLPTVKALAAVSEAQLLKLWEGLGYYSRVRNMQKAAQMILSDFGGQIPENDKILQTLPGIGAYTAGAIASICFGRRVPAVDGNVLRLMTRLTANAGDITNATVKKAIEEQLLAIYPNENCASFTQALMELGAVVCLPGGFPKCTQCPLAHLCRANRTGQQTNFPVKRKKPARKKEERTVFILLYKDKIALRKRKAQGLLGGLWEFPNIPGNYNESEALTFLNDEDAAPTDLIKSIFAKHIFTHMEWHMTGYYFRCAHQAPQWEWVTLQELTEMVALPSAFRAFFEGLF